MRTLLTLMILAVVVPAAWADTIVIEADRDTTLIEDPTGAKANGSGPALFVGRTSQPQGSIRRALVRFDVAGALPEGAVVESATLRFYVSRAASGPRELRVHSVAANWGEGMSFSNGGQGAPAAPGDATWIHSFYPTDLWKTPGGWYESRPVAGGVVSGTGEHVWGGKGLAEEIQRWLRDPETNFGWILIGDESTSQTAVRIDSRENVMPGQRPRLQVEYQRPRKSRDEGPLWSSSTVGR